MQELSSAFEPARGLTNPHLQTVLPTLWARNFEVSVSHERLDLPDGDFLDLAWSASVELSPSAPVLLIMHGLEGNWTSPYVKWLFACANQAGWRAVVAHFRGCGLAPNRLPRSYHSGETGDFRRVVELLRQRYPAAPLCAAGFSLGGNALLKLLGEDGDGSHLHAAVAVSVPFVLSRSAWRLEQGGSRFYQWWFLRTMKRKLQAKFGPLNDRPIDLDRVLAARTMWEFDDAATAPLHGFAGADDYYTRCSSRQYLPAVRRPTLLIHAADDPFMTPDMTPLATELPPEVEMRLTTHGGHVGFLAPAGRGGKFWLSRQIVSFLERHAH